MNFENHPEWVLEYWQEPKQKPLMRGVLRGWVRSGVNGEVYTFKKATELAHERSDWNLTYRVRNLRTGDAIPAAIL